MFNLDKFLSMMKRNGYIQTAVSHACKVHSAKYGELAVTPTSMPDWTFFFIKK